MGRWEGQARYEYPISETVAVTYVFGRKLEDRYLKYCCGCAQEFGYQLWTVDYHDCQICPVHLLPLLHRCHFCRREAEPGTMLDHRCRCGFDIRETPTIAVRADLATAELVLGVHLKDATLKRRVDDNRRLLPLWMRDMTVDEISWLLAELHRLLEIDFSDEVDDAVRDALADWPHRFRQHLMGAASIERSRMEPERLARLQKIGYRGQYGTIPNWIAAEVLWEVVCLVNDIQAFRDASASNCGVPRGLPLIDRDSR
ncbi:hypothetical protein [Ralstonia chuxiongensis]|uniref:hypothetical protein n=1 Tax=Ralstonia chuxiongensis TaxID=2957504 RepID=UPI00292F97B1|nr:hypothetical protein [Ralstonia chuxiongensis]